VITQQGSLSYFKRIMTDKLAQLLNDTSAMTLFLPVDSAWETLDPIERLYLESDFASDDLHKILELHAVVQEGVTWSESFEDGLQCK
jgi:solute carrier family 25 (mitochondrial carnitine/acylcarnitine transporter), member 20/29